ncbi:MAG: hypothetical protein WCK90_06355 [archaeon]
MKNMKFCDNCKSILKVHEENGKLIGVCQCGFKKEVDSFIISDKSNKIELTGRKVFRDKKTKGWPHLCKKCGHGECDITDLGAPYSDESNIYLYKCKKCKFVQRQADGTSNK